VIRRSVAAALVLTLVASSCGGDELSLTEYVERINAMERQAGQRAEQLFAEAESVADFTPQQLQAGLERGLREIRRPLQEAADDIDPPKQIADIHDLMWDWHESFIAIEEALAERAGEADDTPAGWTALSDSSEMAAYRDAIAAGKQVCTDFQTTLDATAERGVFAETPWIPGEMKEVVEAVLGCPWFPENPQDVYRYPPPTTAP